MENKKEQSTASSLLRFADPYLLSDVGCGCRHRVHSKILFLDPFHQRFTYCYLSCAPGCAETDC